MGPGLSGMRSDQTRLIMNRFIFILLLVFMICPAYPQFYGGYDDGSSYAETGLIQVNDQDLYCSGGMDDGLSTGYLISALNDQANYCSGGFGDGFSRITWMMHPVNTQAFYCSGGISDGFDLAGITSNIYNSANYFSGGNDDGYSQISTGYVTMFDQTFYLAGGSDDGFSTLYSGYIPVCNNYIYAYGGLGDGFHLLSYIGPIVYSTAWTGGANDGFSYSYLSPVSFSTSYYCFGGPGDGTDLLQLLPTYFGSGIWLGTISSVWEDPVNWSGSLVPGVTTNVVIPGGKLRYPLIQSGSLTVNNIQGTHICKSLTINEGGSVINKSDLYIYGNVTVSGLYRGDDNLNSHIYIYQDGNLRIVPPGMVIIY